ncbi:MAG: hypothetical protein AseanaTS_30390 [Candidatus Pelagadaptatus aseana]
MGLDLWLWLIHRFEIGRWPGLALTAQQSEQDKAEYGWGWQTETTQCGGELHNNVKSDLTRMDV